jgi:hypothetical protein
VCVLESWDPGGNFRAGLREIVALRAALDGLEAELVAAARGQGCKWRELGDDLGMSGHGVRRRHLAVDPIYAWRAQREPLFAEDLAEPRQSAG